MPSIRGEVKSEQHDYLWQSETAISKEIPDFITIRDVFFPGALLPRTSNLGVEIPISFDTRGTRDVISTTLVHQLTRLPKRDLDAWANSPNPLNVSISWTFAGHKDPVFTFQPGLVADSNPWMVFSQNIKKEWDLASSVQQTTAMRAPSDRYTIFSPLEQRQIPQQRLNSGAPCCVTCGKKAARSKRRRTAVCDLCSQRAASTRALSSSSWDGSSNNNNTAQQQQSQRHVSNSILESTRRLATEAYMTTGSTEALRYAAGLSQTMLAAIFHREKGFP